jgi:phosphoribosyl-AMP cyclohydrolase
MLTFSRLVPVIYVDDLPSEVRFYTNLGFDAVYEGDPFGAEDVPSFASLRQGEVEFAIEFSDAFRARAAYNTILWRFRVNDLAEAERLCNRCGYPHTPPEQTIETGDRWEMAVTSPNGYNVSLQGHAPASGPTGPHPPLIAEPPERTPDLGQGLLTAVVQDASSGEVLMVAHMDRDAYDATLVSGRATFWSRSRQRLWEKGETSGNTMRVVEVRLDCDGDAVLLRVVPAGPACHTGARSCFDAPPAAGGGGTP